MTDDLIKRLRDREAFVLQGPSYLIRAAHDAADALESQQTELTRLRSLVSGEDAQMQLIAQEREALRADAERLRRQLHLLTGDVSEEEVTAAVREYKANGGTLRGVVRAMIIAARRCALSAASEGGENG